MHRLVSRAAQVRSRSSKRSRSSCHCAPCLPTLPGTVARGHGAGVLRPPYRTRSTLRFTSIFAAATATTYDARIRGQRRQQWNQATDGVKQEQGRGDVAADGDDNATPVEIYDDFNADVERNLDSSLYRLFRPAWPSNTGPALNRYHLPPQSIYARDLSKMKAETTRWTQKKMLRVELCMDILQLQCFQWLHSIGFLANESALSSLPPSYVNTIVQHPAHVCERSLLQKKADYIHLMRTPSDESGGIAFQRSPEDVPICKYTQDELGAFRSEQLELRRRLEQLFAAKYQADREPQLICNAFHLLAASSAPPNVDIYNTLMNGLRKRGHVFLTTATIQTFFGSKMRANEVSLAVMLGFYTDTNNAEQFRLLIQKMRGQSGGLMKSKPGNWRFKASKGRIIPDPRNPSILIQLPHPTPMVFDAVVKGVLHFSGFDAALGMCRNLRDEGWGMDMRGFGILLNDCARRGDWNVGYPVWNQIVKLKQRSARLVDGHLQTEIIMTPIFADMLRLCRRCDKKHEFGDVWDLAKKTHPITINRIMDMVKAERSARTDARPPELAESLTQSESRGGESTRAALAAEDSAEARVQALQALAELRAKGANTVGESNLQQEYLALKADVDFLRTMEGGNGAEQSKTRSWAELARDAYNLIASHPTTLERRTFGQSNAQSRLADDVGRPVTYSELAKNAYYLVADHPSTMEKRGGDESSKFIDNVDLDISQGEIPGLEADSEHANSRGDSARPLVKSDEGPSTPVTYTSLAQSAYRLIADPATSLQRRGHQNPKSGHIPDGDTDAHSTSSLHGHDDTSTPGPAESASFNDDQEPPSVRKRERD